MQDESIPYGYCQCGCGRKTRIAEKNFYHRGVLKGQPNRFVHGHGRVPRPREQRWRVEDRGYETPCHISTYTATSTGGYAYEKVRGRKVLAHRVAWMEAHGPIPDGLDVCHHCDVPNCRNVDHLFLGTHAENMADMVRKGRQIAFRGERHPNAKLTEADVRAILAASDVSTAVLARHYGVNDGTVGAIRTGKSWTHISRQ